MYPIRGEATTLRAAVRPMSTENDVVSSRPGPLKSCVTVSYSPLLGSFRRTSDWRKVPSSRRPSWFRPGARRSSRSGRCTPGEGFPRAGPGGGHRAGRSADGLRGPEGRGPGGPARVPEVRSGLEDGRRAGCGGRSQCSRGGWCRRGWSGARRASGRLKVGSDQYCSPCSTLTSGTRPRRTVPIPLPPGWFPHHRSMPPAAGRGRQEVAPRRGRERPGRSGFGGVEPSCVRRPPESPCRSASTTYGHPLPGELLSNHPHPHLFALRTVEALHKTWRAGWSPSPRSPSTPESRRAR